MNELVHIENYVIESELNENGLMSGLVNAFENADDVLAIAAKGIAEVISVTGQINVDFNDVNTVMKDSGVAIMGSAEAEGENRAIKCVENALNSPLLNDNNIDGAKYVLLNITYGTQAVLMDEISDITDYIQEEAGSTADVIWGHGYDESLGDKLCVTIIRLEFNSDLSLIIRLIISFFMIVSREDVASSAIRIFGLQDNAIAIMALCLIPPESS